MLQYENKINNGCYRYIVNVLAIVNIQSFLHSIIEALNIVIFDLLNNSIYQRKW
jgi:hypothetical protein